MFHKPCQELIRSFPTKTIMSGWSPASLQPLDKHDGWMDGWMDLRRWTIV